MYLRLSKCKPSGGASKLDNYGDFAAIREGSLDGTRYPRSVVKFKHETKPAHPTQKPVALMEYLIRTYTNEGDTVLDNCMGSGTTGVACVNTNRRFIGIELDQDYFDIAKQRIEDARTQDNPHQCNCNRQTAENSLALKRRMGRCAFI